MGYIGQQVNILSMKLMGWKQKKNGHYCNILCMGLCSLSLVRVLCWPMSTAKSAYDGHQNWTMEQWKKLALSDELSFLLHHVDGRGVCASLTWVRDVTRYGKQVKAFPCWRLVRRNAALGGALGPDVTTHQLAGWDRSCVFRFCIVCQCFWDVSCPMIWNKGTVF